MDTALHGAMAFSSLLSVRWRGFSQTHVSHGFAYTRIQEENGRFPVASPLFQGKFVNV